LSISKKKTDAQLAAWRNLAAMRKQLKRAKKVIRIAGAEYDDENDLYHEAFDPNKYNDSNAMEDAWALLVAAGVALDESHTAVAQAIVDQKATT